MAEQKTGGYGNMVDNVFRVIVVATGGLVISNSIAIARLPSEIPPPYFKQQVEQLERDMKTNTSEILLKLDHYQHTLHEIDKRMAEHAAGHVGRSPP